MPMVNIRKIIQLTAMKAKQQAQLHLRMFLFCGALLVVFLLVSIRSGSAGSLAQQHHHHREQALAPLRQDDQDQLAGQDGSDRACGKIPPSLAHAIVAYATSDVVPQQTAEEIGVTERVLERRSPCNFLVFGLGRDSLMWSALNHGGRTIFLEEDASWISAIQEKEPMLESHHVEYDTKVQDADGYLALAGAAECMAVGDIRRSACRLSLRSLPSIVYELEWDMIMVDAPTGWQPDTPGRMAAIYTAGMLARARRTPGDTDVFVHDADRTVEDKFSRKFLCEGYLKEQVGRLRHFTIPSHIDDEGMPFCP